MHLLLYEMALHPETQEQLFEPHSGGGGIFIDHLKRYLTRFQQEPGLATAMKRVIAGQGCNDVKMADCLEAAGLVRRDDNQKVVSMCDLYATILARNCST